MFFFFLLSAFAKRIGWMIFWMTKWVTSISGEFDWTVHSLPLTNKNKNFMNENKRMVNAETTRWHWQYLLPISFHILFFWSPEEKLEKGKKIYNNFEVYVDEVFFVLLLILFWCTQNLFSTFFFSSFFFLFLSIICDNKIW